MIIKQPIELARTATREEVREAIVELWAQLLERELREHLAAEAEASGETSRLRAIERAEPPAATLAELRGDR